MYLETAILVKLFVSEPDSQYFAEMVDGQYISSSVLAYTEFWSALLTKEREGALSASRRQAAWDAFEKNVEAETIQLIPFSPAIFKKANRILAECHPRVALCSLDALHLATCDHTQDWPLCTTDARMRQAAQFLNFPLNQG